MTRKVCSTDNASNLYSGDARFESLTQLFRGFPLSLQPGQHLNLSHACFHPRLFKFIIHCYPRMRFNIIRTAVSLYQPQINNCSTSERKQWGGRTSIIDSLASTPDFVLLSLPLALLLRVPAHLDFLVNS